MRDRTTSTSSGNRGGEWDLDLVGWFRYSSSEGKGNGEGDREEEGRKWIKISDFRCGNVRGIDGEGNLIAQEVGAVTGDGDKGGRREIGESWGFGLLVLGVFVWLVLRRKRGRTGRFK